MSETMKSVPWGVHRLRRIFADPRSCQAGLPDGRYVTAVAMPYVGTPLERLRVAWWVFTGRAHAILWPEAGELEDLWGGAKANQYHSGMPPSMSPSRSSGNVPREA
jgi:hypothetical protein